MAGPIPEGHGREDRTVIGSRGWVDLTTFKTVCPMKRPSRFSSPEGLSCQGSSSRSASPPDAPGVRKEVNWHHTYWPSSTDLISVNSASVISSTELRDLTSTSPCVVFIVIAISAGNTARFFSSSDLYIISVAIAPSETDSPLVIDVEAVLVAPIARQLLQAIGRWNTQILQRVTSNANQTLHWRDSNTMLIK